MSQMYSDGAMIIDLDYLVAAQMVCRAGQWMIDVLLALGTEGQTLTGIYPAQSECERAFLAMRTRLVEETP